MARSLVIPDDRAQRIGWLRERIAEHNRLVILVGLFTLLGTVAIWCLLFAGLYWLAFLFQSAAHGIEARPPSALLVFFIYSAGLLVLLTWLARTHLDNARPKDEKTAWEIALECLLAVPRATLAIWGNLAAWVRLDGREMGLASNLIGRLQDERRIPLQQLPLEIPAPLDQAKIIFALQLLEVLEITRSDQAAWLSLRVASTTIAPNSPGGTG